MGGEGAEKEEGILVGDDRARLAQPRIGANALEVTMEAIIASLLAQMGLNIATGIAADQIRAFFKDDSGIVGRSIQATCGGFPEIEEGAKEALQRWSSSDTFTDFLVRIHAGERDLADEIITSFIEEGDFYIPKEEDLQTLAVEIVTAFLGMLLRALYQSEEGLPVFANRMEEIHAEDRRSFEDLRAQISEVRSILTITDQHVEPESLPNPAHRDLVAKVDLVRDLINRGLTQSARADLEDIRNDIDLIPTELEFRIITNLGACALAEEDFDSACTLLEEAYELQRENVKAIANAAVAAHLRQHSARAIELALKARELDSQNPQATAIFIAELGEAGESAQLEQLVATEEWIVHDPQCGLVLANIRAQQSRFEEAAVLCQSIIEVAPKDANAHLALSHCLFNQAQSGYSPNAYTVESLALLEKAESEATQAIEILRRTQLMARRHEALVVRGIARVLLGATDDAMRDLDEVLVENPSHADAAFNKVLLLLQEDQIREARRVIENIHDPARHAETVLPLADAFLATGDPAAAADLLRGTVTLEDPDWKDIRRAEILSMAEAKVGAEDSVEPLLSMALARDSDNPRLLTVAAVRREILGESSDSEDLLKRALEHAEASDRLEIQLRLGAHYYALGRYAEAADCLAQVVNKVPSHPAATQLLSCLVNSRQLREALDWARTMRSVNRRTPKVALEVEAQILDHVGDLKAALLCLEEICSRTDATSVDQVKLASAQFRYGNHDAALKAVSRIDASTLRHEPRSLLAVAQMKLLLGQPDYLNDAYLARRYGIDDPSAYLGYFAMFLGRDRDWVEPEVIEPGCVVLLESNSEEHWWQILENGEERLGSHEVEQNEELAQRLRGKTVGDTVVIREDIEQLSYTIKAIQSKFVRAFQEIGEEFSTRFPGNKGLSRIEVGDDDFTKLFQGVDQRDEFVRKMHSMYMEGRLPFASFCSSIGRSVVEVWRVSTWHATADNDWTRIRFGTGTVEEAREASALDQSDGIVLDLLALLTIYELKIAEHLKNHFQYIAVPQYVVDELQRVHDLTMMGPAPASWLGKDRDGRYSLVETTEGDWANWQGYIRSVLQFAQSFERIASYPLLEAEDSKKMMDVLTPAGAGSIYAGNEQPAAGVLLVCDDLGLSQVAHSFGIKAVNTQVVLQKLHESSEITDAEYATWIERLVLMNYRFVRVSPKDVMQRLEVNGYMTSDGTRAMFSTLEGPDCSEESAVRVAAEALIELAKNAPPQQVDLLLSLVVAVLRHGREPGSVLLAFRETIASRLALVPHIRDWLLRAIDMHIQV